MSGLKWRRYPNLQDSHKPHYESIVKINERYHVKYFIKRSGSKCWALSICIYEIQAASTKNNPRFNLLKEKFLTSTSTLGEGKRICLCQHFNWEQIYSETIKQVLMGLPVIRE